MRCENKDCRLLCLFCLFVLFILRPAHSWGSMRELHICNEFSSRQYAKRSEHDINLVLTLTSMPRDLILYEPTSDHLSVFMTLLNVSVIICLFYDRISSLSLILDVSNFPLAASRSCLTILPCQSLCSIAEDAKYEEILTPFSSRRSFSNYQSSSISASSSRSSTLSSLPTETSLRCRN